MIGVINFDRNCAVEYVGESINDTIGRLGLFSLCTLIEICEIKLWRRYLDDVIAIVPRNSLDLLMRHVNSINSNIQFTYEVEQNS